MKKVVPGIPQSTQKEARYEKKNSNVQKYQTS